MKIITAVCLLTSVVQCVFGDTCLRPDGRTGMCIKYNHCPEIVELVNSSKGGLDLRSYTCGFEGETPKVCCLDCYTPDGSPGKCKHVNTCKNLSALLNDQKQKSYVRNSRCLTGPRDVCCGPPPSEVRPSEECKSILTAFPPHPASLCCGHDANAASKITGGERTGIDEYPWTVLLEYQKWDEWGRVQIKTYCGGSLISNRYVVTAAHCISGPGAWAPINVRLGEYDTTKEEDCVDSDCADPIEVVPIEEIIVHPDYNASSQFDDIALIRMARPVAFTDFVRPICLPTSDVSRRDESLEVFAAGWGRINDTHRSATKQHVKLPLFKLEDCKNSYSSSSQVRKPTLWPKQLCAGGEAGKDACRGDSGGPLMLKTGLLHELIGVVSFGPDPCGIEGLPGVYTHTHPYTIWIRRNIRP